MDLRTRKRRLKVNGGPFSGSTWEREEKRCILMLLCNRTVPQNIEHLATQVLFLSFYIVHCTYTCFCSPTCPSLSVVCATINEINTCNVEVHAPSGRASKLESCWMISAAGVVHTKNTYYQECSKQVE